jgi:hypothetical protein
LGVRVPPSAPRIRRSGATFSGVRGGLLAILAYSALFFAEDADILGILAGKGHVGVTIKIALGGPDSAQVIQHGAEEGFDDAMPAKIRNALTLYRPMLATENVEIRLHQSVLYNSIYRADDQLIVNQHAFGIPAARASVFCLGGSESGGTVAAYLASFERVWATAEPVSE